MKVAGVYIRRRESIAVVYDENGKQLFRSLGDGANYHSAGKEGIVGLVSRILKGAGSIDCMCIGVAGCDREKNMRALGAEMNRHFRDCMVYNNGVIALVGASGKALGSRDSVLVEADTGSVAVGVNRRGEVLRVGGWGYLLGDEGGAFDIGRRAIGHAARAYDRFESDDLVSEILEALALGDMGDVIDLYDIEDPVQYIAELFPVVCRSDSEIAGAILEDGAEALAASVRVLAERLEMGDDRVLYETGRVFDEQVYREMFERKTEGFSIERPEHGPEVGAAMLAMEKLAGRFTELD